MSEQKNISEAEKKQQAREIFERKKQENPNASIEELMEGARDEIFQKTLSEDSDLSKTQSVIDEQYLQLAKEFALPQKYKNTINALQERARLENRTLTLEEAIAALERDTEFEENRERITQQLFEIGIIPANPDFSKNLAITFLQTENPEKYEMANREAFDRHFFEQNSQFSSLQMDPDFGFALKNFFEKGQEEFFRKGIAEAKAILAQNLPPINREKPISYESFCEYYYHLPTLSQLYDQKYPGLRNREELSPFVKNLFSEYEKKVLDFRIAEISQKKSQFSELARRIPDQAISDAMISAFENAIRSGVNLEKLEQYISGPEGIREKSDLYQKSFQKIAEKKSEIAHLFLLLGKEGKDLTTEYAELERSFDEGKRQYNAQFYSPRKFLQNLERFSDRLLRAKEEKEKKGNMEQKEKNEKEEKAKNEIRRRADDWNPEKNTVFTSEKEMKKRFLQSQESLLQKCGQDFDPLLDRQIGRIFAKKWDRWETEKKSTESREFAEKTLHEGILAISGIETEDLPSTDDFGDFFTEIQKMPKVRNVFRKNPSLARTGQIQKLVREIFEDKKEAKKNARKNRETAFGILEKWNPKKSFSSSSEWANAAFSENRESLVALGFSENSFFREFSQQLQKRQNEMREVQKSDIYSAREEIERSPPSPEYFLKFADFVAFFSKNPIASPFLRNSEILSELRQAHRIHENEFFKLKGKKTKESLEKNRKTTVMMAIMWRPPQNADFEKPEEMRAFFAAEKRIDLRRLTIDGFDPSESSEILSLFESKFSTWQESEQKKVLEKKEENLPRLSDSQKNLKIRTFLQDQELDSPEIEAFLVELFETASAYHFSSDPSINREWILKTENGEKKEENLRRLCGSDFKADALLAILTQEWRKFFVPEKEEKEEVIIPKKEKKEEEEPPLKTLEKSAKKISIHEFLGRKRIFFSPEIEGALAEILEHAKKDRFCKAIPMNREWLKTIPESGISIDFDLKNAFRGDTDGIDDFFELLQREWAEFLSFEKDIAPLPGVQNVVSDLLKEEISEEDSLFIKHKKKRIQEEKANQKSEEEEQGYFIEEFSEEPVLESGEISLETKEGSSEDLEKQKAKEILEKKRKNIFDAWKIVEEKETLEEEDLKNEEGGNSGKKENNNLEILGEEILEGSEEVEISEEKDDLENSALRIEEENFEKKEVLEIPKEESPLAISEEELESPLEIVEEKKEENEILEKEEIPEENEVLENSEEKGNEEVLEEETEENEVLENLEEAKILEEKEVLEIPKEESPLAISEEELESPLEIVEEKKEENEILEKEEIPEENEVLEEEIQKEKNTDFQKVKIPSKNAKSVFEKTEEILSKIPNTLRVSEGESPDFLGESENMVIEIQKTRKSEPRLCDFLWNTRDFLRFYRNASLHHSITPFLSEQKILYTEGEYSRLRQELLKKTPHDSIVSLCDFRISNGILLEFWTEKNPNPVHFSLFFKNQNVISDLLG